MNFSISQITPKLISERLRGYKLILAGQIIILINSLVVFELFKRYNFNHWQLIFTMVMGMLMLLMNYFTYELLKDFTENKLIRNTILILLIAGTLMGMTAGPVISPIDQPGLYALMLTGSMFLNLVAFMLILYYMIYDIFNEKHDILYRLWGAACIYMLIGASFSLVYAIVEIFMPAEFGASGLPDLFNFVQCYAYSFYTLAGIDQPFENFTQLVKNISVIESIFSNLYIVLLVGRLLSR